jgi:hypothetical protein
VDPISLAIGAVGLGMQIFGGIGQASNAHKAAQISQDEAAQEQSINNVKQQQMELEGRRANIETARNAQRARALGINAAVQQGSSLGSGLPGGLADSDNQAYFHMQGVNDALSFGRQINAFNQNISQDKMQMANVQSSSATDQGIASLGGAVLKAGPIIGQISQGFGSSSGLPKGGMGIRLNNGSSLY